MRNWILGIIGLCAMAMTARGSALVGGGVGGGSNYNYYITNSQALLNTNGNIALSQNGTNIYIDIGSNAVPALAAQGVVTNGQNNVALANGLVNFAQGGSVTAPVAVVSSPFFVIPSAYTNAQGFGGTSTIGTNWAVAWQQSPVSGPGFYLLYTNYQYGSSSKKMALGCTDAVGQCWLLNWGSSSIQTASSHTVLFSTNGLNGTWYSNGTSVVSGQGSFTATALTTNAGLPTSLPLGAAGSNGVPFALYGPDYIVHTDTGVTNYFQNMNACLTAAGAMANNWNAFIFDFYTYTRTTPTFGGVSTLWNISGQTNWNIYFEPGSRLYYDNQVTNYDSGNTSELNVFNLYSNTDFSISGPSPNTPVVFEYTRRFACSSNWSWWAFEGQWMTNASFNNIQIQGDVYAAAEVPLATVHQDDQFQFCCATNCNVSINACRVGMLLQPSLATNGNPLVSQMQFGAFHQGGGYNLRDCIYYGIEPGTQLAIYDSTTAAMRFQNLRVRYPGGSQSLSALLGSQFTNAVVWFDEQENLSYIAPNTDPLFVGTDQFYSVDSTNYVAVPTEGGTNSWYPVGIH